jgi:hypothetical protein
MATFANDLRLKEIATGDESGTWGTSTNTNLALIADAFSLGTKQMAADADETFTMPDASADGTRSLYLKITSAVSLSVTRTVTLAPNTVSKVWIIENATTGGQSITIAQGSGGTVTIANGSKVMIATDGAGAGAAVINANFTTTTGTVTSVGGTGTVNGISLSGTVTSSGNLTLGGTLSNVSLTTQVTGTLPIANGGTGNTTGLAASATILATARTIGGVSFNGSANINLPGVNTAGNQNTTGSAATLTTARTIGGVSFNGSANINLPGVNTAGNQNTTGTAANVTGTVAVANGGTGLTALGTGITTFLGTPTSANLAAAVTDETGTGALVFATSPTLVTPVLGTPTSGTLSGCTVDGTNAVGFRTIPQNSQSAAYTLVLADSGKHIFHPSADTTARTFTIPANSSVAFPIGTAITFINQNGTGGIVTIAITTDTMRLSPDGTTGSRTLARNGVATCVKITSTEWIISGVGLT